MAAGLLAVPAAAADAATRTVTLHYERPQQPQSLNPQPPITQQAEYPQAITVSYDDQTGALGVHLAIYDAPTWANTLPYVELHLNASCDPTADAPTIISAAFRYDAYSDTDANGNSTRTVDASVGFRRKDYEGTATGTITPAPDGFDVAFQHPALVGLDELRCASVEASARWSQSGYFAGYEPFELTRGNATAAFKDLLASKYPAFKRASVKWALCPREEFFPAGLDGDSPPSALCMAQFRSGRTWRYVSARIEQHEPGVLMDKPYTRTWTRRWRKLPSRCLHELDVRGTAYSNDGTCPALMISDLAYTVRKGKRPRRAYWHGTNTAGFQKLASYRCTTRTRTITCTNALGDAFRWTR
ncbi:hypothetical protein [Candidatus Solirubrobacter pratensis]|uniref:hypothetical protein n=1 Tax=Candidatus Solirubrobacter pratensis TaxID=1298857 RepID=UPI0012DC532E|nr:hypothetical protein [Candidatus Solirubrobacter pratensis]